MSRLPCLSPDSLDFPPVSSALRDPDGLLAYGGDLSPERLIAAYERGIFPWYQDDQPLLWWSPGIRMALHPQDLRISRSMHKVLRKGSFHVTLDQAFAQVIALCAGTRESYPGTWITPEMQHAYCTLHERHIAHSVEVWECGELVGGLYGIALGQIFFGESMFSLKANASKTGFIRLVEQLARWGYQLIDCQVPSAHLASLGATKISREKFLILLRHALQSPGRSGRWQLEQTDHAS